MGKNMKKHVPFIVIILILIFLIFQNLLKASQAKPNVEMLLVDKPVDLIHDIKIEPGDEWFAIVKTEKGFELKKKELRIYEDNVLDVGDMVGVTGIENSSLTYNVILIRGLPLLKEGLVKTIYYHDYKNRKFIYPGEMEFLTFGKDSYALYAFGAAIHDDQGIMTIEKYSLMIDGHSNKVPQKLIYIQDTPSPDDARSLLPDLSWAGDLDDDGKLDLLIKYNTMCGDDFDLYLSSFANKNEVVGLTAHAGGWCM